MKILHTADWHIGSFKGPEVNGVNLRSEDTIKCLNEIIRVAKIERPDLVLVPGDIFHQAEIWQGRSHREVLQARSIIMELSQIAGQVIIMRGTPNHDSEEAFEELKAHFEFVKNVIVVTEPMVLDTKVASVVVVPGFDKGQFRAKFPGLSKEEENLVFTDELGKIVMGLKGLCKSDRPSILMSHYTVPGCNTESGQTQFLTQFEPVISQEMLSASNYDLVALGHIHRPQFVQGVNNVVYSGAVNAMNFNDEGQERGFWIHDIQEVDSKYMLNSSFYKTPYRDFITINWSANDVEQAITNPDMLTMKFSELGVANKIVRIIYSCTSEQKKAFNRAQITRAMYDAGAFYLADVVMEKLESVNRTVLSKQADPETNLIQYLEEKHLEPEQITQIVEKARPIISMALANASVTELFGMFVPKEIEVKNYRNYVEEKFSFADISFCTINGQNGAGKSSLFMDAILDCLYEEPREGDLTGWIRKDEKARSGYISFTFALGEKVFRVVRTRAKSGKGTLNLSELVDGEWIDRSKEKYKDTQAEIVKVLGMDSLTFKACVLIMQDQYGLFLEAGKEERVGVLSNLLGLGIYTVMEELAKNKVGELKRDIAGKKKTIEIHTATISSYGKPNDEKIRIENLLTSMKDEQERYSKEKEDKSIILRMHNEAIERQKKILESINTLQSKKNATEQNMKLQADIIADCDTFLVSEPVITENAEKYRSLEVREKELIASVARYESGKQFLKKNIAEQSRINIDIQKAQQELASLQDKLNLEKSPVDEAVIAEKASQYKELTELLQKEQEKLVAYTKAKNDRDRKAYAVDSKRAFIDQEKQKLLTEKQSLVRRTELLENAGCTNSNNAGCKFLSDALLAKKELDGFDNKMLAFCEREEPALEKLILDLRAADQMINDIGYDSLMIETYRKQIADLEWANIELKKIQERKTRISTIKASIESKQSIISELNKRLLQMKSEQEELEENNKAYEKDFIEHSAIKEQILSLKVWIDKEAELPIRKERKSNAEKSQMDYIVNLNEIEQSLQNANIELEDMGVEEINIDQLTNDVRFIESKQLEITDSINSYQRAIGSLNQKIDEINRLKDEIDTIQYQVKGIAKELSDYDLLRAAFSRDGIPHQIIRSLVPRLTETANSILGQMTGGKMGIEFQTEKIMKSNSNKEVVTLDIFIEEYGKSTLPYLSKSGGEKVKASLSVILALAETKSSSAGIQLGMLFIDEPPFLDADGIQAYCDALETIQKRYPEVKIMAITHDPTMKARFPQSLDVVKTDEGSKVVMD